MNMMYRAFHNSLCKFRLSKNFERRTIRDAVFAYLQVDAFMNTFSVLVLLWG